MCSRWYIAGIAAALGVAGLGPPVAAAGPHDVLVRFKASADSGERAAARATAGTDFEDGLPLRGLQLVDPKPGVSASEAVRRLERSPDVLYAEPDRLRTIGRTPDDPDFGLEWGLHNTGQRIPPPDGQTGTTDADIDAPEAWDLTTGSAGVTVAVVDTGIDFDHPDLSPNIWANPAETSNGADDDGNGFVDDLRGWDFVDGDNDAEDENGHGTHVSGTIGASGNDGFGVTGVAWDTQLMPLRVLDQNGNGFISDLIEAYGYARAKGARVLNASLGGSGSSQSERNAIATASNVLFVVAAGNDGQDNDAAAEQYPCEYDLPNIVCVAATDNRDALADFSNYGITGVDLGAPGVRVRSSRPGNTWSFMSGTSMATPHVAGAAALGWSLFPSSSVAGVRNGLLAGVDTKPSLNGRTVTGGRLNVNRALSQVTSSSASGLPSTDSSLVGLGSAPGGVPVSARTDRSAPSVVVGLSSLQRLATALRRGIRARVRCSEPCRLLAELSIWRSTARRLGLLSARRRVVLGRRSTGLRKAGTTTVTVRLNSAARRRLRRLRSIRLALRIRATDSRGNARVVTRRLTLRR